MIILGINAYHGDSSAAILIDGQLVAAIEEERISRVKHWAGLPVKAAQWCLLSAGVTINDVDYIAISREPLANLHRKLFRLLTRKQNVSFLEGRVFNHVRIASIKKDMASAFGLNEKELKAKLVKVEHHRAHLASGFFVSPFKKAAVVSIDGFGDFLSTLTAIGNGNKVTTLDSVPFPHSLGTFYTAMTQFLGFWHYGDEYKVMGLAAYGTPVYADKLRKVLKKTGDGFFILDTAYFLHDSGGVQMTWFNGSPKIGQMFSKKLIELLGLPRSKGQELDQRCRDIAASVQAVYEDAFFHILNHLYTKTKIAQLVLTGGCAQNSLANGKICAMTPFEDVYIPPAAHDAGGAIGAAFYFWNQVLGQPRGFIMNSPFWGPEFEMNDIKIELEKRGLRYLELTDDALIEKTAREIAGGKVVGWFQGRSEWGPRALGNRSILADPRRSDMKDILNLRIKKREDFRPFAASILEERIEEWFEEGRPVPFMEKVYMVKKDKWSVVPAVTNIDGTCRPQTVRRDIGKKYYDLIKKFEAMTGVPLIINTSFNDNEPIVNTPADALECFLKTKMDCLILENYFVEHV